MTTATLGVPASVAAGGVTTATIPVPSTHVCLVPGSLTFASARSFVEPTPDNKAALANVVTRLGLTSALGQLLVSGHTDLVGSASVNLSLSERRAVGSAALLRDDATAWETLATTEGWADPELGAMVVEVGDAAPGDAAAIAAAVAAVRGPANAAARGVLFHRYFARLLAGSAVPAIIPATPPTLGCGLAQPLRGSAAAPSRDPALPPITGDFRPNRRVEFFFTDGSTSLTCPDYPTWTTACSLAPPARTITVTIAPLATVPNGGTADLQVTLSPSPLPAGSTVSLTISTTGAGRAVFAAGSTTTTTITTSGPVTLRGTAPSSATDDVVVTATVTGSSAAVATEAVTIVGLVSAFVQFEVFNLGTSAFDPLPPGVAVDLMDQDPLSNDLVAGTTTTAGGRAFFNLTDLAASGETNPDLFFLVRTRGMTHAGHTLPQQWSTAGWRATDGSAGLRPSFSSGSIGTPDVPVVFRIGVDVHVQFQYNDDRTSPPPIKAAPQGVLVKLRYGLGLAPPEVATLRTDRRGQLHAVLFLTAPGLDLSCKVMFEIEDTAAGLPRATVSLGPTTPTPAEWPTNLPDTDRQVKTGLVDTSVDTSAAPWTIVARLDNRNVAFFLLTVIREWNTFLVKISDGRWAGIPDLNVALVPAPNPFRPFSWPVGRVNLMPAASSCEATTGPTLILPAHWCRATIVHELSHQIMWQESRITTADIATSFVLGLPFSPPNDTVYLQQHFPQAVTGRLTALLEGWAAFVEAVFAGPVTPPPYRFSVVGGARQVDLNGTSVPLDTPANRGEQVEGAFADALHAILEKHIIVSPGPGGAHIPESANGDILTGAPATWLADPGVRGRFHTMIWQPLQDVRAAPNMASKHTTVMLAAMQPRNPAVWHTLLAEIQAFNMLMRSPTATRVSPVGGPPAGGTTITLTGSNFTSAATVTVQGSAATGVAVTGDTSLTAVTPSGSLGGADVVVTTPAGSATMLRAFTYRNPPVVTAVTDPLAGGSARGSTEGGTSVQIDGTGFVSGATVSFGGTAAVGVVVVSDTRIQAVSPAHCPAEPVDVTVANPDSQRSSLTPGFEYLFLLPKPLIIDVDPRTGATGGGDLIRVTGTGFRAGVRVFLNGADAAVDAAATLPTEIRALTPPGAGLADVVVRNPDCQEDVVHSGFDYR